MSGMSLGLVGGVVTSIGKHVFQHFLSPCPGVLSGPAALCRFTLARGSEVGSGLPPSSCLLHGFELRIEVIQCHWGDVSLSTCGVISYLQTLIQTSRVCELRWYFPCIYAHCSL